jgi:hypothetical protein
MSTNPEFQNLKTNTADNRKELIKNLEILSELSKNLNKNINSVKENTLEKSKQNCIDMITISNKTNTILQTLHNQINSYDPNKPQGDLGLALAKVLLDVKTKYPNFKYLQEGLSFTISTKGLFGIKIFRGVIDKNNGTIIIDTFDESASLRRVSTSSKKLTPTNPPKYQYVEIGRYLGDRITETFRRIPIFNMVNKIR